MVCFFFVYYFWGGDDDKMKVGDMFNKSRKIFKDKKIFVDVFCMFGEIFLD